MTDEKLKELLSEGSPNQKINEYRQFLDLLISEKVKYGLEIGVEAGYSLFAFSKICEIVAGIDNDIIKIKFNKPNNMITIHADVTDVMTLYVLKMAIVPHDIDMFDFVFFDTNDDYDKIKLIYDLYSPLVKKGGLICFHDIECYKWCKDFFDSLEGKKIKFLDKENPYGIGVLWKV